MIRAVPSLYRGGGWDVIRDEPDGRMTVLHAGMRPQAARDLAAAMNYPVADPEDERMARYFREPE